VINGGAVKGTKMVAEMSEQPQVIESLVRRRLDVVERISSILPTDLAGTVLLARGSSDHAAVYGRYVLELASGRPVSLAAPSLHTLYGAKVDYRGYFAVAVSQSGRTPEIVTVLERMKAGGARCLAVTNEPDSPLGGVADMVLELGAGPEEAVPATKTFSAQIVAFALIAEALGAVPWRATDWDRLRGHVEQVLADDAPARRVAGVIGDAEGLISVGRGFLYSAALEAALKLKETTSILAEGYSSADLRHGPIAVATNDLPVIAFVAPGPAASDMQELMSWLDRRGARVFAVSEEAGAALPLPRGLPEMLVVVPAIVRAQQLALWLARHRGIDPDTPAGLSKVTFTQ
jgi:glucosamine--fructose-6-phosphate aminotransferase (isomerizing)